MKHAEDLISDHVARGNRNECILTGGKDDGGKRIAKE